MTTQTAALTLDYVKTIGIVTAAFSGRGFCNPCDAAVGPDGRIFVLNRCDPDRAPAIRVGICNLDEEYLGEFGGGGGSGDGQFIWPVGVALDSRGRAYVTDEQLHRVTVFDSSGVFLAKWGDHGSAPGQLDGPAGIAVDADDNLYLVDQNNSRVQKFSPDGEHILGWGEEGSGAGQFSLPWGIGLDAQGCVYVADWRNDRVQKFSQDGEFLASYGQPGDGDGQFHRPSSVAVDAEGFIYVADWGNERVQVLGPDGSFLLKLRGQATLSKWADEYYAVNPEEKRERDGADLVPDLPEHLRAPYHVSSQTEPYFWGPISVRVDGQGRLYVVESNRHRIQVYRKRV